MMEVWSFVIPEENHTLAAVSSRYFGEEIKSESFKKLDMSSPVNLHELKAGLVHHR